MPETNKAGRWAAIGVLIGLAALGTLLVRVPIPATTGYFNIGDVFVVWAGLWLGPVAGLIVGASGPAIADAIGFPQFILATAVTKGLEGYVVGVLAGAGAKAPRKIAAATIGSAIMVAGYFVFEAYVYPALGQRVPFFAVTDFGAAVVEVIPNTVQGIIGAVGGVALWRAVAVTSRVRAPNQDSAPT